MSYKGVTGWSVNPLVLERITRQTLQRNTITGTSSTQMKWWSFTYNDNSSICASGIESGLSKLYVITLCSGEVSEGCFS